jgi:hypothetical protein
VKPIIFNSEMVRAILDRRKTQTRMPCKFDALWIKHVIDRETIGGKEAYTGWVREAKPPAPMLLPIKCPFGKPGDKLWVRETVADVNSEMGPTLLYKDGYMQGWEDFSESFGPDQGAGPSMDYKTYPGIRNDWTVWREDIDVKGEGGKWCPSIHMPRWASRITLEITDIRVERVQDISEDSARAEGFSESNISDEQHKFLEVGQSWFVDTWNSIYEKKGFGWDANPWVWVVEFKRLEE